MGEQKTADFRQPFVCRWNRKPVSVLICHLSSQPTPRKRAGSPFVPERTFRYTWSCWSWCRHRHMSPYNVVSSCLAVSSLPPKRRFVFCYGIHKITPICAFHSGLPYLSGLSSEGNLQRQKRSTCMSMNYLYPSLRSILSFCALILATAFFRPGVISTQLL